MSTPEIASTDKPQALKPRTMFEKVWQQHVVAEPEGEPALLYVDLQLVHEVTSPQAFDGLRLTGRPLRRPDRHIATVDHNVPTTSAADRLVIADQISAAQVNALRRNCAEFGIEFYDVQDASQGAGQIRPVTDVDRFEPHSPVLRGSKGPVLRRAA